MHHLLHHFTILKQRQLLRQRNKKLVTRFHRMNQSLIIIMYMRDGKASKEVDENGKLHHGFKLDLEDFSMKSDVHNSSEVNLFSNFSCFHQTIEVWCLSNAIKKLINDKYFPFHVINSCRVREHPRRKKRMNLKLIRHRHYRFKSCLLSYHQFRLFLLNFFNFREWKLNDNWNISFVYARTTTRNDFFQTLLYHSSFFFHRGCGCIETL